MSAKVRHIGILETASADEARITLWTYFRQRLHEYGFAEGKTVSFEFRWADGRQEQLAELAAGLVRMNVDVIVTAGTPAVIAASRTTSDIPIVMATGTLPMAATPPNNIVGVVDAPPGLCATRLQRLREVLPGALQLAILADRGNPSSPPAVQETQEAAKSWNTVVRDYWVTGPDDIATAIAAMRWDGIEGFTVAPGALFFACRKQIAALAIAHRLAAMAVRSDYAEAGVLMSYGSSIRENYRQAAVYVDRILRGAKPSELPVYEPAEFEFVINLTTAKALGLVIPADVLSSALVIGA